MLSEQNILLSKKGKVSYNVPKKKKHRFVKKTKLKKKQKPSSDKSEADAQVYWNLSLSKNDQHAIIPRRHQTGEKVLNYKISRGRERGNRFKSSLFYIVPAEEGESSWFRMGSLPSDASGQQQHRAMERCP